jgi:hypothetical protein
MQLQAKVDKQMQERLERFLTWLLDARWFPETDRQKKKRLESGLRKVRRIVARMRTFSKGIPDVRLARGLADWQAYESSTAALVKAHFRSAPHTHISSSAKGSWEIAERLMCANPHYPQAAPAGECLRRDSAASS